MSPVKNNPNPENKEIVLMGCPDVVVKAKAFRAQPMIMATIDINTLCSLLTMLILILPTFNNVSDS